MSTETSGVIPVFTRLFQEHGLPGAIRTDNGTPFATSAIGGLSRLNVWWIKLGTPHQRITPGRPEQNGRHEPGAGYSLGSGGYQTLKREATRQPERDLIQQQARYDRFCTEYNHERPHEALGQETPAMHYQPPPRLFLATLPEVEYAGHMQRRWVSQASTFRFRKGRQLFLSNALKNEWIGLEEVEDGVWSIDFCDVLLARLDERKARLTF